MKPGETGEFDREEALLELLEMRVIDASEFEAEALAPAPVLLSRAFVRVE